MVRIQVHGQIKSIIWAQTAGSLHGLKLEGRKDCKEGVGKASSTEGPLRGETAEEM